MTFGAVPPVPAGAMAPGGGPTIVTPQGNVTMNNTNNVTVNAGEAELAAQINNTIQRLNNDMLNGVAREVGNATPRIEMPIR
jgi:hypothetical protein